MALAEIKSGARLARLAFVLPLWLSANGAQVLCRVRRRLRPRKLSGV